MGEFAIDLPRPRDVAEVRLTPAFLDLHRRIWDTLRTEVMRAHRGEAAQVLSVGTGHRSRSRTANDRHRDRPDHGRR